MRSPWSSVAPRAEELTCPRPGDDLVPDADCVMDRGFDLAAPPDRVWPWLVQLGKRRAGWYLPRSVERFVPPARRAIRHLEPRWQELHVGEVIPDYGGSHETFEAVTVDPPRTLLYRSRRGTVHVSWSINLTPEQSGTRVHLRLRLGPVRRPVLADTAGGMVDLLSVAGLAAGLRERVS